MVLQCIFELNKVVPGGDLDGAELRQVVSDELRIQQPIATKIKACHQMNQCHLAGISGAGEHAFAEKRRPEGDTVQAANQFPVLPAFDAVGKAHVVQFVDCAFDGRIDPCVRAAFGGFGTHGDDFGKIHVVSDVEGAVLHRSP